MFFKIIFILYIGFVINSASYKLGKIDITATEHEARMREIYPELYSNHYEGDIILFDNKNVKNAISNQYFRWPNAIVPFVIGRNFNENDVRRIHTAMVRLQQETCVKFVPRRLERRFILIDNKRGGGCFAELGYNPMAERPQNVNLESPDCMHQGTIEHELLHVLGLFHEHMRPDRDEHVFIYWQNIIENQKFNFNKTTNSESTTFNVPYDFNSVMHYPNDAFTKNGKATIVSKKNPNMRFGQRIGAAPSDLHKIRIMYNCRYQYKSYESSDRFLEQVKEFFSKNGFH